MLDFNTTWKSVEGTAKKMCGKYRISGYEFEDLMQEAMMVLFETIKLFDESYNVKINTFFYLRLRNRFASLLWKVTAQKNYYNVSEYSKLDDEGIETYLRSSYPNPEENLLREENNTLWRERYKALHPEFKKIIAYQMNGMTRREVSKKLNQSYSTTTGRLHKLRDLMSQNPSVEEIKQFNKSHRMTLKRNGL